MLRYLLLAWQPEGDGDSLSQAELDALMRACQSCDDALRDSGYVIAMEHLQPIACAMTVRTHNGRITVTDGPCIGRKERLGGFYLIDARDLNEAIQVAANTAAAYLGERLGWSLEVHPVGVPTPGTPGM